MARAIELAKLGLGNTYPNPIVGAVLVHNDTIIGEGFHKQYGGPHAEVNCIDSVVDENKHLIPLSTLYVTLEPCNHYGKTPPCTKKLLEKNIKNIVVGCRDPFPLVNGKGIETLINAGCNVKINVLEHECKILNKRFFTFHKKKRPYIILKWAQTADQYLAYNNDERLKISGPLTDRLVHKWRAEEQAILIGTNTALKDKPKLTTRLWTGNNPLRLIIDRDLKSDQKEDNHKTPTIIFNTSKNDQQGSIGYVKLDEFSLNSILHYCYENNIQSIIVEGGTITIDHFISENLWDEARVITNTKIRITEGLIAPKLKGEQLKETLQLGNDQINYFINRSISE